MVVHYLDTSEEFDDFLDINDKLQIIIVYSKACEASTKTLAKLEEFSKNEFSHCLFAKIDTEDPDMVLKEVCKELEIKVLPTVVLIRDGEILDDRLEGGSMRILHEIIKKNL